MTLFAFPFLFLLAYGSLLRGDPKLASSIEPIYRSVGIFTGNGSWAFDTKSHVPLLFQILAVLAPILTALGVTELATGAVGPGMVRLLTVLKSWTWGYGHKPVAIVGLTAESFRLALALRSDKYLPIVFADQPDTMLRERATSACIVVRPLVLRRDPAQPPPRGEPLPWTIGALIARVRGVPADGDGLRLALPRGVEDLISFLPTADEQVELASRLRRPSGSADTMLRARFLMADRGLAQRLDDYMKFSDGAARVHVHLTDLAALAARLLLTTHPLDMLADAFGQDRIHIAIWGFGALGRAVAKEAARLYVTRPSLEGKQIRITVIDRDPLAVSCLLAEDPGLDQVASIQPLADITHLSSAGLSDDEAERLIPSEVTAHVIAVGDPDIAFALAVSLRRWLLEPPHQLSADWRRDHPLAPIFVRAQGLNGLGRLLRSGVDRTDRTTRVTTELPDGIFAFGAPATLFSTCVLMNTFRDEAAREIHRGYRIDRGIMTKEEALRTADAEWPDLAPSVRDSNYHAVDHLALKARAIGYRVAMPRRGDVDGQWPPSKDVVEMLAKLEHRRWMAERMASGWRKADARCDAVRVHPDLIPWRDLADHERALDRGPIGRLPDVAAKLGLRWAEALVIGITGHRADAEGIDVKHVKEEMRKTLSALLAEYPARALVLLTSLATGTDSWAAEVALELDIPYIVPLPLPYETYVEDFADTKEDALSKKEDSGPATKDKTEDKHVAFRRLIASAEYYFELPLYAGRVSELTGRKQTVPNTNALRRAEQYARAGAYIVERSHVMISVWDGKLANGLGGTGEVTAWKPQTVPSEFQTNAVFRPRIESARLISVSPNSGQTASPLRTS